LIVFYKTDYQADVIRTVGFEKCDYVVSGQLRATKGKQGHNFVSKAGFKQFRVQWAHKQKNVTIKG
jgi:hypothetical protein